MTIPGLEHLLELISGVRKQCSDPIQCLRPHFELQPKVVPLFMHILKLLQYLTKVIQGQYVLWKIMSEIIYILCILYI